MRSADRIVVGTITDVTVNQELTDEDCPIENVDWTLRVQMDVSENLKGEGNKVEFYLGVSNTMVFGAHGRLPTLTVSGGRRSTWFGKRRRLWVGAMKPAWSLAKRYWFSCGTTVAIIPSPCRWVRLRTMVP